MVLIIALVAPIALPVLRLELFEVRLLSRFLLLPFLPGFSRRRSFIFSFFALRYAGHAA